MTEPPLTPDADATGQVVGLLMEHRHRLYAFIAKQIVNAADVEDVFQKTSIVVWRKAGSYDPSRSFFHWACGIAFNEVRNFLRTRGRSRLHFDADLLKTMAREARDEDELSAARLGALRACMATLDEPQQAVLAHCYQGSTTITDVAAALGRTRDALYKQLGRLRVKLLDCIRRRLGRDGGAR